MPWFNEVLDPFVSRRQRGAVARRRRRPFMERTAGLERLESRKVLAHVAPQNFPIEIQHIGNELYITYSQPDLNGFSQTSDQHVVIDIDEFVPALGAPVTRVNVYASTNPQANGPYGGQGEECVYLDICAIHVTVPNYDDLGVNNNSLAIKGINGPTDRIIVSGSGRTSAGRWSDEASPQLQVVFDIAGIDDLAVTAGGVINVSGAFTNDTGDASIHAVGEIAERQADQTTATIIVGETTPAPGSLPQARLVSNFIEIIGAELDIYSDIEATDQVILRQPATTPQTARAHLILPYDVTVTDPAGVLELHSTRNIVQLQSSTLTAHKLVAVSNVGDINVVDGDGSDGPWLIDVGTATNDFDTISLGMVSNAIDTPDDLQSIDARGRIGVRDIDDLTVGDFGVLATTGIVTLRSVGALTVDAAVQAAGLTMQSDTSVATTSRAIISVNSPTPLSSSEPQVYTDLGVTIDVSAASGSTATGDVTLDGRIVMDLNNVREQETTTNANGYGGLTIHAAGVTSLNSQVLTLGDIRVASQAGIKIAGQLQAGGTFISKDGSVRELVAADLSLTTAAGDITVAAPTANLPLPTTLSATNLLAMDAGGDVIISGSLFAGSIYGNTAALPEDNQTLPSITIRATGDVSLLDTAVLKTTAYGTNYNASPNPQIGLITVADANSFTSAGSISADGAFTVSVRDGIEVYAPGPITAREWISLKTQAGDISVQGPLKSTGASYATSAGSPPFVVPASWTPDVVLDAPNGGIRTSNTGTLTAGTLVLDGTTSNGTVRLNAQQDIDIGAAIDTAGSVVMVSKLGEVTIDALVKTVGTGVIAGSGTTISAGAGVSFGTGGFGRVEGGLDITVTDVNVDSDVSLVSKANVITRLSIRNLSPGGDIDVASDGIMEIASATADGSVTVVVGGTLSVTGQVVSTVQHVELESRLASVTLQSLVSAPAGSVSVKGKGGVTQVGGGLSSITLISGGQNYTNATRVTIAGPASGLGSAATAVPVIEKGVITSIRIVDAGTGYASGEKPAVTIVDGSTVGNGGNGAAAVGVVASASSLVSALDDITIVGDADLSLSSTVHSIRGDVNLVSAVGGVLASSVVALAGTAEVSSAAAMVLGVIQADEIIATSKGGLTLTGPIMSSGATTLHATVGDLNLAADGVTVDAGGTLSLISDGGRVSTPPSLVATGSIFIVSRQAPQLEKELVSRQGGVSVVSQDEISLNCEIKALGGSIDLVSNQAVVSFGGSITKIVLVGGGGGYDDRASVVIAPPSNGGIAATARPIVVNGRITEIVLVTGGSGYAPGEQPIVRILPNNVGQSEPGTGATAISIAEAPIQRLHARDNVTVHSGGGVLLFNTIEAVTGSVDIRATTGDLNVGTTGTEIDAGESVKLTAVAGAMRAADVNAGSSVDIYADGTVSFLGGIDTDSGNVKVASGGGDLDFTTSAARINAPRGSVELVTANGSVLTPPVLSAGENVTIRSFKSVALSNEVTSDRGTVAVESTSGGITLGVNLYAPGGSIKLAAQAQVEQLGTGVATVSVLAGGSAYTAATLVTLSPPAAAGGTAATARPVIGTVDGVVGVITGIQIVTPGAGYAPGELVSVFIDPNEGPGAGAYATARAATNVQNLQAKEDISITAGSTVTLINTVSTQEGDISVTSKAGNLSIGSPNTFLSAAQGSVTLAAPGGQANLNRVQAGDGVVIDVQRNITLIGTLVADTGDVAMEATSGNVDCGSGQIHVSTGSLSLISKSGSVVLPPALNVMGNLAVESFRSISLSNEVASQSGDIAVVSTSGGIELAANVVAPKGGISLNAKGTLTQLVSTGLSGITVLNGGSGYQPGTTVTVARPQNGGTAATARAVIGDVNGVTGVITAINILSPGSGYAPGEQPLVTITQASTFTTGGGGQAQAIGPAGVQNLTAEGDIVIATGADISMQNVVSSASGDIVVSSETGRLALNADSVFFDAKQGSVRLAAQKGSIAVERVYADEDIAIDGATGVIVDDGLRTGTGNVTVNAPGGTISAQDIHAGGDISLEGLGNVTIANEYSSSLGDITAVSKSGSIALRANVVADNGKIALTAKGSISQAVSTGLSGVQVTGGGSGYASVTVRIAPPVGGGTAATATATTNTVNNVSGVITAITLTSPGSGYAPGETPAVTIIGALNQGVGATAQAIGPTGLQNVRAGEGVAINAGADVTLVNTFTAATGDITVESTSGKLSLSSGSAFFNAVEGGVKLTSLSSQVLVQQVQAADDIVISGRTGVTVDGGLRTSDGVVITSQTGGVSARSIEAENDVTMTGAADVLLGGTIFTKQGDIKATSGTAAVGLAANVVAVEGAIVIKANGAVTQSVNTGIGSIQLISGGSNYSNGAIVTVAPPAAGGSAATAIASIDTVNNVVGVITGITVTNPGSGYAPGETPAVTISGINNAGSGAAAIAIGPSGLQNVAAGDGIEIVSAGADVKLLNTVTATGGDIMVNASGGVSLAGTTRAHEGGVTLESVNASVTLPPVLAAKEDITIKSFSALNVGTPLVSTEGGVSLFSSGGGLALNANVLSPTRITLDARSGVAQSGFVKAPELVVTNRTTAAVNLASTFNDVDQVAISSLGAVTYYDADDFETGVVRSGGALPVEVSGDAVTLASIGTGSTIRVVSGLKYRTLSVAAGLIGGTGVGTVEYVTTSTGDNPPATVGSIPVFAGTLRDMISYANDNTATYLRNGSRLTQPQSMVFDESDYDVTTVTVSPTALPAFTKPVAFNGGRLTESVLGGDPDARLGIAGATTTPAGLTFGVGSSGSQVTRLAIGGFKAGSGLVLNSGGTSVTNVWAGLNRSGSAAANRAGVEISGASAIGNRVGSVLVDPTKQNMIANNTAAGVLVRGRATATEIYGNRIVGNGDGVRINNATGTLVGTPDAVQPDDQPSVSNTISGNLLNGVQIVSANAGSYATANRLRNNRIEANRSAGVAVTSSKFAIIGALGNANSNTVVNQVGAGFLVTGSTDVRIRGNQVGVDGGVARPNGGDGMAIVASQRVDVSGGNRISGNRGSGVVVSEGSTAVTVTANTIGEMRIGNGVDGVAIRSSTGNTVGAGNVVAFNGRHGVSIADSRATSVATGNRVVGSLITANRSNGVQATGGSYSTIGGTKVGEGNEIRGNGGSGIRVAWNATTGSPTGYAIQGNVIGTNRSGDVAPLGNAGAGITVTGGTGVVISDSNTVMNNAGDGIVLEGGSGNVVGAGIAGKGNTIAANVGSGVRVRAASIAGMPSTIQAAKGHAVWGASITGNTGDGISVDGSGTAGVVIGNAVTSSSVSRTGNTIADNAGYGISLGSTAKQVGFQGNTVYGNALGAFSLPTSANPLRATSLTLSSAVISGAGSGTVLTLNGQGRGAASQQYSIDVYANSADDGDYSRSTSPALNSSGYQARRFLGRVTVIAGTDGTFFLKNVKITAAVEVGEVITMTATSLRFNAGSTSALSSANVTADLPGIPTPRPPY
jgi:hypothetical protein